MLAAPTSEIGWRSTFELAGFPALFSGTSPIVLPHIAQLARLCNMTVVGRPL